jgi:hypothetical protein
MDNGVVNSDQGQTNLPNNNFPTNSVDSTTMVPSSDSPSNQYPNNTDIEQNGQPPNNASPQLTQADSSSLPTAEGGDLLEIKRSALQSLLPIVGKLDQSPEERFQTLLMVIQASDNPELIKEAYETAGKISDESKRAQALLAIINEVNFFTQPPSQD